MFITLIVSIALAAAPKVDQRLVGTWLAGNQPFITFAGNGTGTMEEGRVKWTADGASVTITDETGDVEKAGYQVDGDTMTMTVGGIPVALKRSGVAVKKQSALAAKAAKANQGSEADADKEAMALAQAWLAQNGQRPQQPRGAGNDQLSQLLTSSAWCSFSYNKTSGASSTTRVRYFPNGTWSLGGQSETYNSGAYGSMAGQANSQNSGLWEVRNGQLYGSYGNAPVEPVQPFSVTRNSNGSPILNVLGKEYSLCN